MIQHPGNNATQKKGKNLISLFSSISLVVNITIQGGERANLTGLAEKLQEAMKSQISEPDEFVILTDIN
jgi:hypothetical protein